MFEYVLALNPGGVRHFPIGIHHPAVALFCDGELKFGVEEDRYTRDKYAYHTFPENALTAALEYGGISMSAVDRIAIPWQPALERKKLSYDLWLNSVYTEGWLNKILGTAGVLKDQLHSQLGIDRRFVEERIAEIHSPVPKIEWYEHHHSHAASAFHFAEFNHSLTLTLDGKGESESTVVWEATDDGLKKHRVYQFPNSLGRFYRAFCEFLGYPRKSRAEGKIMGLAPYGDQNDEIETALRSVITTGVEYDVSYFADRGAAGLEVVLGRKRNEDLECFTTWQKDLAYTAQSLLEEIVTAIVKRYASELDTRNVCLAGGIALNCKLNQQIRKLDVVDNLFVQPAAHDGGLVLGAGALACTTKPKPLRSMYLGPEYSNESIREMLNNNKIEYSQPNELEAEVAAKLADGKLVGWFQGRTEFGPRALGNRSILADPRSEESRDRVNQWVKHRESWRPFAPAVLAEAASDYFLDATKAPFMIETFQTNPKKVKSLSGVVHPGDNSTRPQTVTEAQNPRFYRLLSEFGQKTGVPVLLNTSFNDSGEPIVNTPREAVRDFYGMGLDILVLEDFLLKK